MPTTARGFRYPASTDDVRPYEDIQFLAQDVNDDITNNVLTAYPSAIKPIWTITSTSATAAVGTSLTVIASGTSSTYKAHTAYVLKFRGIIRCNTAPAVISFEVRDTNAAGTARLSNWPFKIDVQINNRGCYWEHVVANTTGSDITSRVLALCINSDSAANTVVINAASSMPWFFKCVPIGLDTDFPEAVAL
jgi:hypothetical protein